MRNAKKTLSLVMIAIFTTFIVLSGIPAGAVTTAQAKAQVTKATAAVVKVEKTVKVANFNVTTAQTQLTAATKEVAKVKSLGKTYTKTYTALNLRNANVNKKIAARKLAIANAAKALAKLFTDADAAVVAAEKATNADEVDLVTDEAALANAQGAVTAALEFIVKLDKNSSNYKGLMARVDSANNLIVKAMDEKAAIEAEAAAAKAAEEAAKVAAEKEAAAKTAAETAVAAVEKAPLVTAADATAVKELSKTAVTAVAAVKEADKATFTARLKVMDDKVVALEAALKAKADADLEAAKPATITATAAEEAITVTFSKATAAPVAADFVVMKTIGTAAATTVTGITVTAVSDTVATLKVPATAVAAADQSVVYTVSYKDQTAVATAAYTVAKFDVKAFAATGTKTLKVTFATAVDSTKAVFSVKNGSVLVNTVATWNDTKTEATLTAPTALAAGEYTVTVTGLTTDAITKTATVSASTVTSITVKTTGYRNAATPTTVTVGYTVLNQYNEDITTSVLTTDIIATPSVGTPTVSAQGTVTLTGVAETVTTLNLVLVDKVSGKSGNATVTMAAAKAIAELTLSAPVIKATKTRLESAVADYKVPFAAKDQYGNAMTTLDLTKITFISSNTTVFDPATGVEFKDVDADGTSDLCFDFGTFSGAKEITVTTIINATGKSSTLTFTVYGTATADAPTLVAPTVRFGATDTNFKVQLTMNNNYGTAMTADEIVAAAAGMTITSGNTAKFTIASTPVVKANDKAYVQLNAVATGSTNLTVTLNATGKTTTLALTVVAAKYAATMTLVPNYSFATSGAAITLKATFVDQYGDAMSTSDSVIELTEDNTDFGTPADTAVTTMAAVGVQYTASGVNKVTKVTATLKNGTTIVDTKSVTLTSVKADAVLTYKVKDIATVAAASNTTADYVKTVSVYAVDAAGNKVALPATGIIQEIKTADAKFDLTALAANQVKAAAIDTDGVAVMNVVVSTNTGVVTIPVSITFSKVAAKADKIEALAGEDVITKATIAAGTIDLTSNADIAFAVTDQYGTTALSTNAYVTVYVQNTTTGVVTKLADMTSWSASAGTYKVSAFTNNGLSTSVEVTVQ